MPIADSRLAAIRHHLGFAVTAVLHPAAATELRRIEAAYGQVAPFDPDAHHRYGRNPWKHQHQSRAIQLLMHHLRDQGAGRTPHLLVVSLVPDQITQHLLARSNQVTVVYPTTAAAKSRAPYMPASHAAIVGSALTPAFHRLRGPWDAIVVVDVLNHVPTVASDRLARHFVNRVARLAPGRPVYMSAVAWVDDVRYRRVGPAGSGAIDIPTYSRSRAQLEGLVRKAGMAPLYLNTDVTKPDHHRHHLVAVAPMRRQRPQQGHPGSA